MTSEPSPQTLAVARRVDRFLADQAMRFLRPVIEAAIADDNVSADRALHVTVLDPRIEPPLAREPVVLVEYQFGRAGSCEVDYGTYARMKARQSWIARADTGALRERLTGLATNEDAPLVGGVHRSGWTLGVSGALPWFDEALGVMAVELMRAVALQRLLTDYPEDVK